MGFADEFEVLEDGASTWQDRLSRTVEMESPQGDTFSPKWKGDPREMEKKLGIFEFPGVNGNIVQDLGVNSTRYTLTLFFDGKNNDIVASQFFEACKQKGWWYVNHPVHGFMSLQLIKVHEENQPLSSGGITEIVTDWIEPIEEGSLLTVRELVGIVDDLKAALGASAGEQYEEDVFTDTYSEEAAITGSAGQVGNTAVKNLEGMAAGNDVTATAFADALAGLNAAIDAEPLDPGAIAGNLRGIIQAPALGSDNIDDRLDSYETFIDEVIAGLPDGENSTDAANEAATAETALTGALASCCEVVTTGSINTRIDALSASGQLVDILSKITDALEAVQDDFATIRIDRQYYSQTQTYSDTVRIVSSAVKFLLISAFDLSVEKRFHLKKPACPIGIVAEEYGDDSRLDEFLEANHLHGLDVLWLDAGREVVLYV